jgi:predicted GNAT family acetyltransferase
VANQRRKAYPDAMDAITITRHTTPTGGEIRATLAGHDATARLTWQEGGTVWIADHTLVPGSIGGRGVAARLVEALIEDARASGARMPTCSYVAAAFARHPEWADMRATG